MARHFGTIVFLLAGACIAQAPQVPVSAGGNGGGDTGAVNASTVDGGPGTADGRVDTSNANGDDTDGTNSVVANEPTPFDFRPLPRWFALFVTGDGTHHDTRALLHYLRVGLGVTPRVAAMEEPPPDSAGADLIVTDTEADLPSVSPDWTFLATTELPVVAMEGDAWVTLGLSESAAGFDGTDVDLQETAVTEGLPEGEQTVYQSTQGLDYSVMPPLGTPTIVARLPGGDTEPVVFVYPGQDNGPGPRVAVGLDDPADHTRFGWQLQGRLFDFALGIDRAPPSHVCFVLASDEETYAFTIERRLQRLGCEAEVRSEFGYDSDEPGPYPIWVVTGDVSSIDPAAAAYPGPMVVLWQSPSEPAPPDVLVELGLVRMGSSAILTEPTREWTVDPRAPVELAAAKTEEVTVVSRQRSLPAFASGSLPRGGVSVAGPGGATAYWVVESGSTTPLGFAAGPRAALLFPEGRHKSLHHVSPDGLNFFDAAIQWAMAH